MLACTCHRTRSQRRELASGTDRTARVTAGTTGWTAHSLRLCALPHVYKPPFADRMVLGSWQNSPLISWSAGRR